ncbi:RNA-binding S4 domain-containing protein [Amorphus orientalis]|uniref:Ribosome-associated heat shock protein Hsp15 n=1 Tax=Amorphus orientalis TaxID=649198 RepID=A0AAE4AQA1_9HYPH|nr:S4 domain-containing protein [Amorphus orientalis]MDQ0313811.1 ribosome-associated heat shock protein Hsp15 [Amorphus orientalis]
MAAAEAEPPDRLRLDLWIWRARLAKTRGLAQELIAGGKVRVNRDKVRTSGRRVGPGDVVTITGPRGVRVLKIQTCPERRGSAAATAGVYEDLTPPPRDPEDPGSLDR